MCVYINLKIANLFIPDIFLLEKNSYLLKNINHTIIEI